MELTINGTSQIENDNNMSDRNRINQNLHISASGLLYIR